MKKECFLLAWQTINDNPYRAAEILDREEDHVNELLNKLHHVINKDKNKDAESKSY